MKTEITTSIVLDARRKRKDGLYPIKLRITFNRYSRYYGLGYALTTKEFDSVMGKAPRNRSKDIRKALIDKEEEAREIINDLTEFSFIDFDKLFLKRKTKSDDMLILLVERIALLNAQDRIKTARSYHNLLTSMKKFTKRNKIPFERITVNFLHDYERWMISKGKSITTVGIYCRNLRAIFNEAIAEGITKHELYPFGRRKYNIPTGRGVKKALSKDDVLKIIQYEPKSTIEGYSRDMWVFSYLANGMNFTDIANLKQENISDGFLIFIRSKTKWSTRSKPVLVKVFMMDELKVIIEKWGNNSNKQNQYLFPILDLTMTIQEQIPKVELVIRSINYHMDKIAKSIGITKKVTTYTARHTFSTVLKRSGASIEFISESLGHQNISTTRHYLDSFEDDEKIKWSEKLL